MYTPARQEMGDDIIHMGRLRSRAQSTNPSSHGYGGHGGTNFCVDRGWIATRFCVGERRKPRGYRPNGIQRAGQRFSSGQPIVLHLHRISATSISTTFIVVGSRGVLWSNGHLKRVATKG